MGRHAVGVNGNGKTNGKVFGGMDARVDPTKQRTFTKRLNLNSELCMLFFNDVVENMNSGGSLEKLVPQTSKNEKKTNFSFRKEHDSYRAMTKKTALEKYISESLENLECPAVRKKVHFLLWEELAEQGE